MISSLTSPEYGPFVSAIGGILSKNSVPSSALIRYIFLLKKDEPSVISYIDPLSSTKPSLLDNDPISLADAIVEIEVVNSSTNSVVIIYFFIFILLTS